MAWIRSGYYKCKECDSSFYVTVTHVCYPTGKGNKKVNITVSPKCIHCGGRVISIRREKPWHRVLDGSIG